MRENSATPPPLSAIPIPAGATADDWPSITVDGEFARGLLWSTHNTDRTHVAIEGVQFSRDGRYNRGITVYAARGELEDLTADEARALADKLLEAADALDGLQ